MQVQGVKLHVGCELKCTFNNIQVLCKLHVIVNETVYWLAPIRASGRSRKKRRILQEFSEMISQEKTADFVGIFTGIFWANFTEK